MSDEYKCVCLYKQSMLLAASMFEKGIITKDDYNKIDRIIADKYGINSCSIYRQTA